MYDVSFGEYEAEGPVWTDGSLTSTQLSQHSARTHTHVFSGLATVSSSVLVSDWSRVARHVLKLCHDWFVRCSGTVAL